MRLIRLAAAGLAAGAIGLAAVAAAPAQAAESKRVTVTGEVIDSWCYLSEIMWATGSAHHRCAVWCARGGVPVGILGEDEDPVRDVLVDLGHVGAGEPLAAAGVCRSNASKHDSCEQSPPCSSRRRGPSALAHANQ